MCDQNIKHQQTLQHFGHFALPKTPRGISNDRAAQQREPNTAQSAPTIVQKGGCWGPKWATIAQTGFKLGAKVNTNGQIVQPFGRSRSCPFSSLFFSSLISYHVKLLFFLFLFLVFSLLFAPCASFLSSFGLSAPFFSYFVMFFLFSPFPLFLIFYYLFSPLL